MVYEGELRTTCTHIRSGSAFETDAPIDNHGKGERFSPTDLMATSLGTCMITVMAIKAKTMRLELNDVKIEVEKIMKTEPRRVGGINLTFHFPENLKNLEEKTKDILKRVGENCPVMLSLNPEIAVDIKWNW